MSSIGLKHTTYFSSKSRVLGLVPRSAAFVVAAALGAATIAYFAIYYLIMGWGPLGFLAAFLPGVVVMALEVESYRAAWGRGLHYVSTRRIATSFLAANVAWLIALVPAALIPKRIEVAIFSAFVLWTMRSYVAGAVFSNVRPRTASAVISTLPTPIYNILILYRAAPQEALVPSLMGSSLLAVGAAGLVLLERGPLAGLDALSSFLDAWAGGDGRRLEGMMSSMGLRAPARGALVRSKCFTAAIPYVHPGPFKPVGSYNLPSELFQLLDARYGCGLALHGPVDHDSNIASNEESHAFAERLSAGSSPGTCGRLSVSTSIDGRYVRLTGLWIGDRALLLFIEPIDGLEDFNGGLLERIEGLGSKRGIVVVPIDAHNKLGPDPGDAEESEVLRLAEELISAGPPKDGGSVVRCGCARRPGGRWPEIGPGGITAVALEDGLGTLTSLVVVDANNAAHGVRDAIGAELRELGFGRFIFCTTDTHDSTGAGSHGYFALGESSRDYLDEVVQVARSAKGSMEPCGESCVESVSSDVTFAGHTFLGNVRRLTSRTLRSTKVVLMAALVLFVLGYVAIALA